jgi:hypothetical protein
MDIATLLLGMVIAVVLMGLGMFVYERISDK